MQRENKVPSQETPLLHQTIVGPGINVPCSIHEGLRVEYVSVDPKQANIFKCVNCISEESVPQHTLIPINLILTSDARTIFTNFPITDRQLALDLRSLAQQPSTSTDVISKIQAFFKDFRAFFIQKLDTIQGKMIEKAKGISDFGTSIIEQYNQISAKTQLKAIVNDTQKSTTAKSAEIKEISQKVLSKNKEYSTSIRTALNKLSVMQSAIDFETPKKIQTQLISELDKIDMFLVQDFTKFQQLVERNTNDPAKNISKLMRLVTNKLNGISPESSKLLESQLNLIAFALSAVEIPEIGAIGQSLEKLNVETTSVVSQLVKDLSEIKPYPNQNTERSNLQASQIAQLVSSKANYCSNEYIEDVKSVMKTLEKVLAQFSVRNPKIQVEHSQAFNSLNEKQLLNLAKLATKTNSLTQQHADAYLNSKLPQQAIQTNSSQIWKRIGIVQNLNCSEEKTNPLNASINEILVDYPIFDLLPPMTMKMQLSKQFTHTNYEQSKEISITQLQGGVVQLSLHPSKSGQFVSNILDNQLSYVLKLRFTRPIGDITKYGFSIGLIPHSKIDLVNVLSENSEFGFTTNPNQGASIISKGSRISSSKIRQKMDSIEFRWCIAQKKFFFADENYTNINQVNENYFNSDEQYQFGVYFSWSGRPADMHVQITEFAIIDSDKLLSSFEIEGDITSC